MTGMSLPVGTARWAGPLRATASLSHLQSSDIPPFVVLSHLGQIGVDPRISVGSDVGDVVGSEGGLRLACER